MAKELVAAVEQNGAMHSAIGGELRSVVALEADLIYSARTLDFMTH